MNCKVGICRLKELDELPVAKKDTAIIKECMVKPVESTIQSLDDINEEVPPRRQSLRIKNIEAAKLLKNPPADNKQVNKLKPKKGRTDNKTGKNKKLFPKKKNKTVKYKNSKPIKQSVENFNAEEQKLALEALESKTKILEKKFDEFIKLFENLINLVGNLQPAIEEDQEKKNM